MGITTALNTTVGSNPFLKMMSKLLVVACAAVAVSADAEAGYLGYAPALLNAYPNWPGVSTPYSQSTCYGCRPGYAYGKRSADAEAEADPALLYGAYGYGAYPYAAYGAYPYGYRYGLTGVAGHPGAATSFVARSPQGLGKRSADADPALLYGTYGYGPFVTGNTYGYGPSGYTVAQGHPGFSSSYQSVTRLH